jgi:hypothetical protein
MSTITMDTFVGAETITEALASAISYTRGSVIKRFFEASVLDAGGAELAFGGASKAIRAEQYGDAAHGLLSVLIAAVREVPVSSVGQFEVDQRFEGVVRSIQDGLERETEELIESLHTKAVEQALADELAQGVAHAHMRVGDFRRAVGKALETVRPLLFEIVHA